MDWPKIIFDLMRGGLSGAQIAERVGVAAPTLNCLKNGTTKQPKYSTGVALLDLHRRYKDAGLIKTPCPTANAAGV